MDNNLLYFVTNLFRLHGPPALLQLTARSVIEFALCPRLKNGPCHPPPYENLLKTTPACVRVSVCVKKKKKRRPSCVSTWATSYSKWSLTAGVRRVRVHHHRHLEATGSQRYCDVIAYRWVTIRQRRVPLFLCISYQTDIKWMDFFPMFLYLIQSSMK